MKLYIIGGDMAWNYYNQWFNWSFQINNFSV